MSLRRSLLLLPLLLLLLVAGTWYWLLHTQAGARWIWAQVETLTDGKLVAGTVSGDLSGGISIGKLAFASDSFAISAREISFVVDLDVLPKIVTVSAANLSGIEMRFGVGDAADGQARDIRKTLEKLKLPVQLVITDLRFDDLSIEGQFSASPITIPAGALAGRWQNSMRVDYLDLAMPGIDASANARLSLDAPNELALGLRVRTQAEITGLETPLQLDVNVNGPLDELNVRASTDTPAATIHGRVAGITANINWDLYLEAPGLVLTDLADLPDMPPLLLTAHGTGDSRSFASDAEIRFAGTDMQVTLAAEGEFADETLSTRVGWQNAHWPIGDAEPRVESRTGKLALSGTLDNWTADGDVDLFVRELPPGQFTIAGRGNRDLAVVDILDSNVLGGAVAGRAEYSWREHQAFAAQLDLDLVHTGTLLPKWPAVLSGSVDVAGQRQPFEVSAELNGINGELRAKPLRAHGRIDLSEATASVDDLQLQHGDTSLHVDGQLFDVNGLRYDVRIDELGDYVVGSTGAVTASGVLSLRESQPFLRIDASSTAVSYGDLFVENLVIRDRTAAAGILDIQLTADTITYAATSMSDLHLQTSIDSQSQSIGIDATTGGLAVGLDVTGALDNWDNPSSWTGQITRLAVKHEAFSASLANAADILLTKQSVVAKRVCIVGEQDFELCLDGSWHEDEGIATQARLTSAPVDLVNAFIDTRLRFDQTVSGEFDWQLRHDSRPKGRVEFTVSPGTVVNIDHSDLQIETAEGRIGFDIEDGGMRSGVVHLPMPDLGHLAGEFEVPGVADGTPASISGNLDIDIADVEMVGILLPSLDNLGGHLRADLEISGALDAPIVAGEILFEQGSMSYLPIGLALDDVQLRARLFGDKGVELTGSFRAGDGNARIVTRAGDLRTDTPRLKFQLSGTNLSVIDVPDVSAAADADIEISFDGKNLDLGGKIAIPRAVVKPTNIGGGQVVESVDVIIVAGELPDDEPGAQRAGDLQITGSLDVELGDDVVIDLEVAQANLTGRTVFTWTGDPIPQANGRFKLAGEILAFGQKLDITEGSVAFADVPANDPYLRIRAEREIFGNTQVRQAGVLVAGNLSRPTIEAYTVPLTTEERALTLLVTGSEFDYEKGIGAVGFGTYIAPRVYASYDIGLFDTENVIRVRYDLTRGLGITATSGQKDSGVDLSYRIEK